MNLPFSRSYWVQPGRVLAGYYPGDRDLSAAEAKLNGLLKCGVSHVINLMEAHEVDHDGRRFVDYEPHLRSLTRQRGKNATCTRFEIVDQSVPTVARMNEILNDLDAALAREEVVYVHCWGGRGRTGTVIACYLQRARGLAPAAALSALKDLTQHDTGAFWPTPETSSQRAFVATWREHS